jgi:hypothetical protein
MSDVVQLIFQYLPEMGHYYFIAKPQPGLSIEVATRLNSFLESDEGINFYLLNALFTQTELHHAVGGVASGVWQIPAGDFFSLMAELHAHISDAHASGALSGPCPLQQAAYPSLDLGLELGGLESPGSGVLNSAPSSLGVGADSNTPVVNPEVQLSDLQGLLSPKTPNP